MDTYNRQAAELIFRENNAPGRVAGDELDLHGLYVDEAEAVLEARVRAAKAERQRGLHVIVGKGIHSRDHVQKLKPAVERICRDEGIAFVEEANQGRIWLDLSGQGGGVPQGGQAYGGGGAGGGQYGQHHQQHHQHQQQQQQGDEIDEVVKKVLPRIIRSLERCCVVM